MQTKKQNKKQLAYSAKKVSLARALLFRNWIFCLLAVFVVSFIGAAVTTGTLSLDSIVVLLTGAGGYSIATMATIGNMAEISDKLSSANQIGMKVWLIAREQIDPDQAFPSPNPDRELGTIPLLAGQVAHYFDAIPDTIDEIGTATKGEIVTDFSKTFSFTVASNREKHLDFIEEYAGKGFIIIYELGEDATKYVLGSYYKPMVLMTSDRKGGGKEGRYITFTFQNKHWRQPLIYVGTITTQAATTVAAGATNLTIGTGTQYQLSDHSADAVIATVSGIGSADYSRVIEVLAPATDSHPPTIEDNNVFVMIDGSTWTANPGSRISFKIIDDATLVEVAGTRVQTA